MFREKNILIKTKSKQKVLDESLQFRLLEELKQIQDGKETDERLVQWLEGYFQIGKKEEQHFVNVKEQFYQYSILELYRPLIESEEEGYDPIRDKMSEMFNFKENTEKKDDTEDTEKSEYSIFMSYLDESIDIKTYEGLQLLTILLVALQKIHDMQKVRDIELIELMGKHKNSMNSIEDYEAQFKKGYYLLNITRKILDHFRFPKQFYQLKLVIGLQQCKLDFTREYIEPMMTAVEKRQDSSSEKQKYALHCLQLWLDRCDIGKSSQKMIIREVFEKLELLIDKMDENNPYRDAIFQVYYAKKNEVYPIRRSRPVIYSQGAGSRKKYKSRRL
jgi:hypothetical protein